MITQGTAMLLTTQHGRENIASAVGNASGKLD